MTHEPKPEEKPHAPKAAAKADPVETSVKREARKILKAYREANPDDPRDDDELMRSANGPLEVAQATALHEQHMEERLRRLAASNPKARKAEE